MRTYMRTLEQRIAILESLLLEENSGIFYHGNTLKGFGTSKKGIHVGTELAATEALEARIGVPAKGHWDGTRVYSKTKLAGRKTLAKIQREERRYVGTGYNCGIDVPEEDYFVTEREKVPTYSDGTPINVNCKPCVFKVIIIGRMKNDLGSLISDEKANMLIKRSKNAGYYYINDGEDSGSVSACVPDKSFLKII